MASSPEEVAEGRQWMRLAAGVMLVLASGLAFSALYRQAGDRQPVLVAATDIGRFDKIEQSDVKVVLVAAEPGAQVVPESDMDKVVGQVSMTDLPKGSILSPGQLVGAGELVVGEDEALVGANLPRGSAPMGALPRGTRVLVVIRPQGAGDEREIPGCRLAELGEPNPNNGTREASLIVPQDSAGVVAAAAAEDRIAVVALEGGT